MARLLPIFLNREPIPITQQINKMLDFAQINLHHGSIKKAKKYAIRAKNVSRRIGDDYRLAIANITLGDINYSKGKFEKAFQFYITAHNILRISLAKHEDFDSLFKNNCVNQVKTLVATGKSDTDFASIPLRNNLSGNNFSDLLIKLRHMLIRTGSLGNKIDDKICDFANWLYGWHLMLSY